jgi:hypothetical protein
VSADAVDKSASLLIKGRRMLSPGMGVVVDVVPIHVRSPRRLCATGSRAHVNGHGPQERVGAHLGITRVFVRGYCGADDHDLG